MQCVVFAVHCMSYNVQYTVASIAQYHSSFQMQSAVHYSQVKQIVQCSNLMLFSTLIWSDVTVGRDRIAMLDLAKRQSENSKVYRWNKTECICKIQLERGGVYWIQQKSSLKARQAAAYTFTLWNSLACFHIHYRLTSWPSFKEEEEEYGRRTGDPWWV